MHMHIATLHKVHAHAHAHAHMYVHAHETCHMFLFWILGKRSVGTHKKTQEKRLLC
jgi:hypothetical protein